VPRCVTEEMFAALLDPGGTILGEVGGRRRGRRRRRKGSRGAFMRVPEYLNIK